MTAEIIRELTVIKDRSEETSEQVLPWAKRIEAQESKKAINKSLKETKFDMIRKTK